ncbi:hypothetical protein PSEUBRA_003083 [Kalmanozyma brasiliensis GHG001]|uniref:uncharacterized protein n=1 Tax=Kalmanozyma brasiliensis (strain GHG001) TaxID=1365824 RepID=UPI002867FE44|nr:uncharacterized protein PSEUBRA_003083 [Kalmanozyma brasiliensis GHG001]KAF6767181.1 hypothetical protein PSEUBRA_003083 [Kalmanozyma brasiliensis GHG001]
MTLLGLKGIEDELESSDVRTLSSYIDRLGTQLLFSTPRDIHLVMAFELLLAHEPGLIGTGASQFEPEGRGFGLASENLFTCAVKIARELRLDEALTQTGGTSTTRLANISLWCCLRTWEGVYAFLGEKITAPQDLNRQFASTIRKELYCIDDDGRSLPSAPRLQDAGGPTAQSFHEMREFCSSLETQLGRDGILRSAGRSVLCLRLESTCTLFSCLQELQDTLSNLSLSPEEKWERISVISRTAHDDIMMVRHKSKEDLGIFAGQRLVRAWEQLVHAECCFASLLYASYATSALLSGKMDAALETAPLVRLICQQVDPHKHIGEVGLRGHEVCRTLLATIQQMDRQPSRRRHADSRHETSFRYLHRLPTLLICAMTVYAARRSLETIAFSLVAFAHSPPESLLSVTLMEAAAQAVRRFSPACSIDSVDTVAQVSADYIEEMVETAHLWEIYYRVYRPVPNIQTSWSSQLANAGKGAGQDPQNKAVPDDLPAPQSASAMDFLADAATARSHASTGNGTIGIDPLISPQASRETRSSFASTGSLDATWTGRSNDPPSSHMTAATTPMASSAGLLNASIFDANMPFDLEAFLRDVDQLF